MLQLDEEVFLPHVAGSSLELASLVIVWPVYSAYAASARPLVYTPMCHVCCSGREKRASCEERQRRAEQARDDVQRALDATVDANR